MKTDIFYVGAGGGGSVASSSYNFTGASGGSGIVVIRNT